MINRDSNIELLRLVCMFMIVFQHCIHLCAFPEIWDTNILSTGVATSAVLIGFSYVGVNCFVLISGYYGIRLRLYSFLKIYLVCAFYGLIGYLIHLYFDGAQVGKGLLYHSLLCLSHSKLWFIKCYVGLMLLSPLLNAAISSMSHATYKSVILLLTVFNLNFGFVWQDPVFNADGYTVANFVYIYMIGGYISRYVTEDWSLHHRSSLFATYLLSSLLWSGSIVFSRFITVPWDVWGYNNPFTLIGALCFFIVFRSIPSFKSKWINGLAAGTLAVYVVHSGDYFEVWFKEYVGSLANYLNSGYGMIICIIGMAIVALLIEVVICFVDKGRDFVVQPIVDRICKYCTR